MKKENSSLVSICIPCYNAADFIEETLKSVFSQTYSNIEVIVCDDRSADKSIEVVRKFDDPRLQLNINPQNLGCSGNYNHVLSFAKGKYVKMLCADDTIEPDCVEKQVKVFEDNGDKNIVLVTANKYVMDENGKRIFTKKFPGKGFYNGIKAIKKSVRHGTNIFGEPGLPLMRTETLRKTTGVIEDRYFTYCNDFDLWCKLLLHGNLYVINEKLFNFRIVTGSVTSNTGMKQVNIFKDYIEKLYSLPEYQLTKLDKWIGKGMTNLMSIARNIIYKLYFTNK